MGSVQHVMCHLLRAPHWPSAGRKGVGEHDGDGVGSQKHATDARRDNAHNGIRLGTTFHLDQPGWVAHVSLSGQPSVLVSEKGTCRRGCTLSCTYLPKSHIYDACRRSETVISGPGSAGVLYCIVRWQIECRCNRT